MSKFLELVESSNPENHSNPKWELIDFLRSKGVNISLVKNTDMLYIDTGSKTIAVNVSSTDEDEAMLSTSDAVNDDVERLAQKADAGTAQGAAAGPAKMAQPAVKQRLGAAKEEILAYNDETNRIKKNVQQLKSARNKPIQ